MRVIRNTNNEIRRIHLYAERCSGSNYLQRLLERNLTQSYPWNPFGWKHGFPSSDVTTADDCLFLVLYRHPIPWIKSLSNKRWHASPELKELSFSDFIRAEWMSVYDDDYHELRDMSLKGQEIMIERHPDTGERFRNVLHLRTEKTRRYEALAEHCSNVCFINYEDLATQSDAHMRQLENVFALPFRKRLRAIHTYKGKRLARHNFYKRKFYKRFWFRPEVYPEMSIADYCYVFSQLDGGLEKQIGY